jgi:hypothetical protein
MLIVYDCLIFATYYGTHSTPVNAFRARDKVNSPADLGAGTAVLRRPTWQWLYLFPGWRRIGNKKILTNVSLLIKMRAQFSYALPEPERLFQMYGAALFVELMSNQMSDIGGHLNPREVNRLSSVVASW